MRTVSLLRFALSVALIFVFASCSDPIFWTTQNEKKIPTNTLPKVGTVTSMASDSQYFYVSIGGRLYHKLLHVDTATWERISLPWPCYSVGGSGSTIYVAAPDGVYTFNTTTLLPSSTPIVSGSYPGIVTYNDIPYIVVPSGSSIDIYRDGVVGNKVTSPAGMKKLWGVGGGKYAFDAGLMNQGSVTLEQTLHGNTIRYVFGLTNNFFGADGVVQSLVKWKTDGAGAFGSALFDVPSALLTDPQVKAFVGFAQGGYAEIYNDGGALKSRSPVASVRGNLAYRTSDLADATVTGFYAQSGSPDRFFIFTSNHGLWQNKGGVLTWE